MVIILNNQSIDLGLLGCTQLALSKLTLNTVVYLVILSKLQKKHHISG